jgi:pimeloyl-ACP methyl ester carboxylesterase
VYDRAGRGWSDPADGRQDGAHIAADLHTLLDRAHVPGPYVLAGHSFGGLYVLSFAAQFPDQVAGMVLLDSTAPKAGPAPPTNTRSYSFVRRVAAVLPAVAHLGAGRSLASFIEELLQGSASVHQASSLTDLSGKPLIILTADTGHDATWQSAQDHLATLSTNSVHRVAKATTHQSLIDDEADSAAASAAIHDVVASVRTSQPIASR